MFFASIFSYAHRRKLCALAFEATRRDLRARASDLAPNFARFGITLCDDRLSDVDRTAEDALCDPRPLKPDAGRAPSVRRATLELAHTLDHLERYLSAS